jgi:hypothetical protein
VELGVVVVVVVVALEEDSIPVEYSSGILALAVVVVEGVLLSSKSFCVVYTGSPKKKQ